MSNTIRLVEAIIVFHAFAARERWFGVTTIKAVSRVVLALILEATAGEAHDPVVLGIELAGAAVLADGGVHASTTQAAPRVQQENDTPASFPGGPSLVPFNLT